MYIFRVTAKMVNRLKLLTWTIIILLANGLGILQAYSLSAESTDLDRNSDGYFVKRFLQTFTELLKKFGTPCTYDSECPKTHWCKRHRQKGIHCEPKSEEGSECDYSSRCLTGYCFNGKCMRSMVKINEPENLMCTHAIHCHSDQYCNKNRCTNRTILGFCLADTSCMSNSCLNLMCTPPRKAST